MKLRISTSPKNGYITMINKKTSENPKLAL